MSIITSFVNVIAGASVLLGGESFMNKKIGGSDVPLRNAIGVPLLGVGTLGILVSYIRNRRVREDKKAESDFYEAELYEAEDDVKEYHMVLNYGSMKPMKKVLEWYSDEFSMDEIIEEFRELALNPDLDKDYNQLQDVFLIDADDDEVKYAYSYVFNQFYKDGVDEVNAETFDAEAHGDWLTCKDCYADRFIVSGVADDYNPKCNACGSHNIAIMSQAETFDAEEYGAENDDDDDLSDCQICGEMFVAGALNQHPTTLYTTCNECFENELEEDDEGWVDVEDFNWDAETFEATPYGESDNEYPVRIIVGGPPHSGKSTLMNLLEDKMNQYGIPVELRDLDFSSPTNLKAGFDPNRKTKDWTEELARDAANYFREDSQDQIVLGDSIGLISRINEIVSEPADVAILLVSGSKDQYDESFRNALEKWKSYYDFIDLPILMVIRSSMNPNEMNYFDPHDNYGVIVGLDRDAYKDGGIDNEISLENACLEGMVFEIAQEYDLELANRNTDEHIATISEKWPNIEGKPTWNPIDAGKPHLGKIEDDYFSTFNERRKAKAMGAESFGAEKSVCRCGKGISNPKCKFCDSPICSDCDWQYANNCIECFGSRFNAENDPDFDREKADRNKDGVISDWEQSVGNAVAKGIREHGQKKDKSSSIGDMEHYMNMRWNEYTPRDKREMWMMDLHYGHSNKNTKRYFKKGYEMGWKRAREKTEDGEPLYMVARAKDLLTTSPRKDGFLVDAGAYMGFEDSWLTYEGKEPVNRMAKVMNAEPLETHMAEEEADFYTVLYRETLDDHLEVDDDYDNLNEAMSAYQNFINQGMEQVVIAGYDEIDEGGYEEQSVPIAEYLVDGYDRRPQSYQ